MTKRAALERHRIACAKHKASGGGDGHAETSSKKLARAKFAIKPDKRNVNRLCVAASDARTACVEYREDMLDRWSDGKLSNIDLCTVAWKHTKSHGRGVADIAANPAAKGRNHARAARRALGV